MVRLVTKLQSIWRARCVRKQVSKRCVVAEAAAVPAYLKALQPFGESTGLQAASDAKVGPAPSYPEQYATIKRKFPARILRTACIVV